MFGRLATDLGYTLQKESGSTQSKVTVSALGQSQHRFDSVLRFLTYVCLEQTQPPIERQLLSTGLRGKK